MRNDSTLMGRRLSQRHVESHIEREGDQSQSCGTFKWVRGDVGPVFLRGNFLTTQDTIMTWAEIRPGSC